MPVVRSRFRCKTKPGDEAAPKASASAEKLVQPLKSSETCVPADNRDAPKASVSAEELAQPPKSSEVPSADQRAQQHDASENDDEDNWGEWTRSGKVVAGRVEVMSTVPIGSVIVDFMKENHKDWARKLCIDALAKAVRETKAYETNKTNGNMRLQEPAAQTCSAAPKARMIEEPPPRHKFEEGDIVRLVGLVHKPSCNGQTGTVLARPPRGGTHQAGTPRVVVQLDRGTEVAVEASKLELLFGKAGPHLRPRPGVQLARESGHGQERLKACARKSGGCCRSSSSRSRSS